MPKYPQNQPRHVLVIRPPAIPDSSQSRNRLLNLSILIVTPRLVLGRRFPVGLRVKPLDWGS
jgi:hypothetical protein